MPFVTIETLKFSFPEKWTVGKYDEWSFYKRHFEHVCGGSKAVDILAVDGRECMWLIEVKDYRRGHATTSLEVANVVAAKVRDTLAGLAAARVVAIGDERKIADDALSTTRLRVVFHMESPPAGSPLFDSKLDRANMRQRLRQLIGAIDSKLEVVDSTTIGHLPWTMS